MLKMDFQRERWKSIFARWGRTPNPVNSPVAGAGCALGSRILDVSELPVIIAEALPGEVPVPLQLFQGGSD